MRMKHRFWMILLAVLLPAVGTAPMGAAPAAAVEIQRVVSDQGIEAWLIEDHANSLISLTAQFIGGATTDPHGRNGRASFAVNMLLEGAGPYESQVFRQRVEDLSAAMEMSANRDQFTVSMSTLTRHLEESGRLLRLALTEPRFDPPAVERVRATILDGIARDAKRPATAASDLWWRLTFPDHPYGRRIDGTLETVAALTTNDLRAFVREQVTRDKLILGVVGDITPQRLGTWLDAVFGGLPATGAAANVSTAQPKVSGKPVIVVRDLPQSRMVFGHQGIARSDPDYYAAFLLNHILGGAGFGSRLTEEVREQRGLTYGVYTYLLPLRYAALIKGGIATRNAAAGEAVEVITRIWRDLATRGPTNEELEDAKTYTIGAFALTFTSSSDIADTLVAFQYHNLGLDYIERRASLIRAVTREDMKRVARRLLDPDHMTFVMIGQPEGVEPPVVSPDDSTTGP